MFREDGLDDDEDGTGDIWPSPGRRLVQANVEVGEVTRLRRLRGKKPEKRS
jgi:hypothetical protein